MKNIKKNYRKCEYGMILDSGIIGEEFLFGAFLFAD
jgi:hypothetical protein